MRDPLEGITSTGHIRTGAAAHRIDDRYAEVLAEAVGATERITGASLYVYGSVVTGMARSPGSDIDLLTVGVPPATAADIGRDLSERYPDLCRAVEVAPAEGGDFVGPSDAAHGGRVFLHHYCVRLTGPDHDSERGPFRADARAARGFNGDIGDLLRRWRDGIADAQPVRLGRGIARKTLLAMAGIGSIRRSDWTTDRGLGARWWAESRPTDVDAVRRLEAWAAGSGAADREGLEVALEGLVADVARTFADEIGLWS